MPKGDESLREQLLKARANIARQIEIMEAGSLLKGWGGGPDFERIRDELAAKLNEIDDSLAGLKQDDA